MTLGIVVRRSVRGSGIGLGIGMILCVFPLLGAVAAGSTELVVRGSRTVELVQILIAFLVGGAGTGFLAGALSPLAGSVLGAAMVGVLASVPVSYLIMTALGAATTGERILVAAIVSITLGGTMGVIYRQIFLEDEAA